MFAFERRWVEIILGSFAPPGGGALAPEPGEVVDYLGTYRSMLVRSRPVARVGLRAALWLVALAPLWLLHRPRAFRALSLAERQALLARLMEHAAYAVREAAFLLKLVACLALFANDALRARSGYDGAPRELVSLSGARRPAARASDASTRARE